MKTCLQCHFLSKETRLAGSGDPLVFSLRPEEREAAAKDAEFFLGKHYNLCCHMGVWDEGVGRPEKNRETTLKRIDRSNGCFFFPHRTSMLFPAAIELQKREQDHAELKRSHFHTRLGLFIAAGALLIDAVVSLIQKCVI